MSAIVLGASVVTTDDSGNDVDVLATIVGASVFSIDDAATDVGVSVTVE